MTVNWTAQAYSDLERLRWFVSEHSEQAADVAVQRLVAGAAALTVYPRRGPVVERYLPREVRRLLIGDYELCYETRGDDVFVIAVFHTREDR